ncbi:uncharacterized protein METZ01_LOCUS292830, partial [marine metagenome]
MPNSLKLFLLMLCFALISGALAWAGDIPRS